MNLLFLTYQGDIAGATNSIAYLTKGLADRGHQVYMGCREESLLYHMLENTKVHRLPMHFRGKIDFSLMRHLRDVVKEYDIELINAQSSLDRYTSIFARWRYGLDVKVVHTRRQMPKSIGGLQNQLYIKGTDKIVVISDELKRVFMQKGFPPNHLHVIYNGTPISHYQNISEEKVNALRNKFGLSPHDLVIGCISRMKEQQQLVQALVHINDDVKVIFAGIPPGSLDAVIQKYAIKNQIIYAGDLSHEDALHLYKTFTVSVLASIMDGFGLVLVEAMGLEVPVVATNAGGIRDVVQHNVNGLLFENENTEELAACINAVLYDEEKRKTLIMNGKKTAFEKFTIERTIDNYETFFGQLIGRKG